MSIFVAGFVARMQKWTVELEDKPAPTSDGKHPGQSSPDDEAQKDWQ